MRPDVRAVVRDEDGDVADDVDAEFGRAPAQRGPLLEEDVLAERVKFDAFPQSFVRGRQRRGLARAQIRVPVGPRRLELVLQGGEQGKVFQPFRMVSSECLDLGLKPLAPAREGCFKRVALERRKLAEIDVVDGQIGQGGQVFVAEQALLDERVQRDEQHIAREGRRARIRRIPVAGRPERQHLPESLAGRGQVLDKSERRRSQVAGAETTRQRGRVQQNAGASAMQFAYL